MNLKCEFFQADGRYVCDVSSANITARCIVKSFDGVHKGGKTNHDVVKLQIIDETVHYLPSGISKIFPNLKILIVRNCGLKVIEANDLKNFKEIEKLDFYTNELTTLPNDLFRRLKKLNRIDFDMNEIEFMSSKLFGPIPDAQWKWIDLKNNPKISKFWNSDEGFDSFRALKDEIDKSCLKPADSKGTAFLAATNFESIWKLNDFHDFTVVCEGKEFPVHKNVLAIQSSVFASMFKNDEQVKSTNKLEIKDCVADVVGEFLKSLYTGEVGDENALELFSLAHTFDVEFLKKELEDICVSNVNEENALKAHELGKLFGSAALVDAAYDQIKETVIEALDRDILKQNPDQLKVIMGIIGSYKKPQDVDASNSN